MPFVCWVTPMPQMRQERANGGRAYQRAAAAMSLAGTPVTRSAWASVNDASDARHAGAGPRLEPEVRLVAQLDPLGVDDDEPRATADGPAKANRDHRVVRGGVGADHHEAARLLVVLIGVRRGAGAHGGQHRLDRGRVAEPRAVVHVVRPHNDAAELLDRVAVLVGGFGARESTEP